ncbi:MAG: transposase family protein [Armatimonadetes bacterium]|nr:transposase family protein [Armatimonadota bacterium]
MKRQAATPSGLARRLQDLQLGAIPDPRQAAKTTYSLAALLAALVTALVTRAKSLRAVEARTAQFADPVRRLLGVKGRVADNTLGAILTRVELPSLLAALHRGVLAEHRRGNLRPTTLAAGALALDGKNVATLHWPDLCRLLVLDPAAATPAQVKELWPERFPNAQLCVPQAGTPYALVRVHTATLISAAAVCVHQCPIPGATNEIGALPALLDELAAAYGNSRLFQIVTTDAGNTSCATAARTKQHGWDYFAKAQSRAWRHLHRGPACPRGAAARPRGQDVCRQAARVRGDLPQLALRPHRGRVARLAGRAAALSRRARRRASRRHGRRGRQSLLRDQSRHRPPRPRPGASAFPGALAL